MCDLQPHCLRVINGEDLKSSIEKEIRDTNYELVNGVYQPAVPPDGYVVHTLKWVIYLLLSKITFEEVVQMATNMGNDSDTVEAIAGGLAGLYLGFDSLPSRYVNAILRKEELNSLSVQINQLRSMD